MKNMGKNKKIIIMVVSLTIIIIAIIIAIVNNKSKEQDNQDQNMYQKEYIDISEINENNVVEIIYNLYDSSIRSCKFKEMKDKNYIVECYRKSNNELMETFTINENGTVIGIETPPTSSGASTPATN